MDKHHEQRDELLRTQGVWMPADRRQIPIATMGDEHLINTIGMLGRWIDTNLKDGINEHSVAAVRDFHAWAGILLSELQRRVSAPARVEQMLAEQRPR